MPQRHFLSSLTAAQPFSILLIDDDDVAAEAVVRGLRKQWPGPIVIAEDGLVALQILRVHSTVRRIDKPYVALLDLNMPRMSGFEFLRGTARR